MRADPAYRKITAKEFLDMDFGTDRKFELSDGVIYMMTGGTEPHAWVQGNIFAWLHRELRGSGCRPYNSDMAIWVSDVDVRYPDISIFCGGRPDPDGEPTKALSEPIALIEVLSPSTTMFDQGTKLDEYRRLKSVQTIGFVDPTNELCRTMQRLDEGWLDHIFSARTGIPIPALNLTIPHDEIFARD